MISGRITCELAVAAVFCVLVIFLFPSVQGPYSVVHGPATALLASRAASRTKAVMVQAASRSRRYSRKFCLTVLSWVSQPRASFQQVASP